MKLLPLAAECNRDIACWEKKLSDKESLVVRKAVNVIARFGRDNAKAIEGLLPLLAHRELKIRNEALSAVDFIAIKGSQAAVNAIDELKAKEEGRSIWNNFKREALPARSRLAMRTRGN